MAELRSGAQQPSEVSGTLSRGKSSSTAFAHQQMSVSIVTEFVRWNEEAVSRCNLLSPTVRGIQ
jgi:hypothetical protein